MRRSSSDCEAHGHASKEKVPEPRMELNKVLKIINIQ
jgi:hypothetical protein